MDSSFEKHDTFQQDPQDSLKIQKTYSLKRQFLNFFTNTTYKLDDALTTKILLSSKYPQLTMLGKIYTYQHEKSSNFNNLDDKKFYADFKQIIWFSYRQNIQIESKEAMKRISDQGWGCLIRVAQMLLAQCISKHLCVDDPQQHFQRLIITMFSDYETDPICAPYSIQQIIKLAQGKFYNIKIGQWYSGPKIMSILETLHNTYSFRLFEDLRIINFYEQCINEDEIYHAQKQTTLPDKGYDSTQWNLYEKDVKWRYSLLIVIHCRLGLDKIAATQIPEIKNLMQMKYFVGILGGKSNKAYYILGFQNDYAIYIDPHYVKECHENKVEEQAKFLDYFADHPKVVAISDLSPSLGFSFYLRNESEYLEFKKEITQKLRNSIFSFSHDGPIIDEENKNDSFADFEII